MVRAMNRQRFLKTMLQGKKTTIIKIINEGKVGALKKTRVGALVMSVLELSFLNMPDSV